MRILIVLPGALGDVIRALPLLGRIRHGLPDAHLAWAVEPLSAPLLSSHPWLDTVHVFARRTARQSLWPFLRSLRAGRYDLALDLGRGIKSGLLTWSSGAPRRYGFARADGREGSWWFATDHLPVQGPERAKLEQFLAFGDLLGVPPVPIAFGLRPTAAEDATAAVQLADLPRPLLAACVGSSCPSRRWEPERLATVVRAVNRAQGGSAVLLGATADVSFAATVAAGAGERVRNLVGQTSLRQLQAVLSRSDVVFGPDSGALHLAAALGKPVVSLWGATSAGRSTPWGSERWTIVGTAPCAPCFLRDCPIGRVCMQTIAAAEVERVVGEALAA